MEKIRTAVVTLAIGEEFCNKIASITHPSLKEYANKIGSDFIVLGERKLPHAHFFYEKFQIIELFKSYDRIIYLDSDIIVRADTPNLFNIVPEHKFGAVAYTFKRTVDAINIDSNTYGYGATITEFFNAGVMVISKCHLNSFFKLPDQDKLTNLDEQSYLNLQVQSMGIPWEKLPEYFNYTTHPVFADCNLEDRSKAYILHYAGFTHLNKGEVKKSFFGLVDNDLKYWSYL